MPISQGGLTKCDLSAAMAGHGDETSNNADDIISSLVNLWKTGWTPVCCCRFKFPVPSTSGWEGASHCIVSFGCTRAP